ncbi:response regulator transcription factor [Acetatifactor muris]|nr:response regulator transcription factor [Acetatifactor muris]MCI8799030.1 response regulator transcription factor [Lachnospiraceae bacterium]MCR2049637.1 response regulator transcription factor [Acetatifactor muris]
MSIRVMLADDHTLVRQGIRQLLESDKGFIVTDEAGDGRECIEKLLNYQKQNQMPDLLLLDIFMPVRTGIEVLQDIRNNGMNLKVLIVTGLNDKNDEDYLVKVFQAGADGYLLKNCDFAQLKKAIHIVLQGEKYIQSELAKVLNTKSVRELTQNDEMNKLALLTEREKEILIYVARGMLNKEIASSMNIAERTVKNHLSHIFRKIDVYDRTQAAVFAIKNGMILI